MRKLLILFFLFGVAAWWLTASEDPIMESEERPLATEQSLRGRPVRERESRAGSFKSADNKQNSPFKEWASSNPTKDTKKDRSSRSRKPREWPSERRSGERDVFSSSSSYGGGAAQPNKKDKAAKKNASSNRDWRQSEWLGGDMDGWALDPKSSTPRLRMWDYEGNERPNSQRRDLEDPAAMAQTSPTPSNRASSVYHPVYPNRGNTARRSQPPRRERPLFRRRANEGSVIPTGRTSMRDMADRSGYEGMSRPERVSMLFSEFRDVATTSDVHFEPDSYHLFMEAVWDRQPSDELLEMVERVYYDEETPEEGSDLEWISYDKTSEVLAGLLEQETGGENASRLLRSRLLENTGQSAAIFEYYFYLLGYLHQRNQVPETLTSMISTVRAWVVDRVNL